MRLGRWRAWAMHAGDLESRQPPNKRTQRTPASHTTRDGSTVCLRDVGMWACGHVGMRHSGGVPRGDSRTNHRRSRRRICSVPSSSSQCASARSTRRSTCPQLACACCGLNERLFANRQCKAQITLSARIAELWPRASSSRSVAPCRSKEALPTRMAGRRSPTRLSRSLGSSLVDAASCRNTAYVSPRPP
jgi:hypothetical protein